MKMKLFLKKNWNYIVAILIPWILIVIHSFVNESWLSGKGTILAGDSGTIYYELYVELWNKIREGGSAFFTWNLGGGTDFFVNICNYLISPFTLLVLAVPKVQIVNALQLIMVMKWSLLAFTSVYYFEHSKDNHISNRKQLTTLILALVFCMSNAQIFVWGYLSSFDVIILFPVYILLIEGVQAGKRSKGLYGLLLVGFLCNWRLMVPVSLFLILWYIVRMDRSGSNAGKQLRYFVRNVVLAAVTAGIVIVPCIMTQEWSTGAGTFSGVTVSEYAQSIIMSFTDMVQRFLICDTLPMAAQVEPMLYCSITALVVALLYIFVPARKSEKIGVIALAITLVLGMTTGVFNILWHACVGIDYNLNSFAFLLIFVIAYMMMRVLEYIQMIRIRYILLALVAELGVIIYTFFHIELYQDFYVYLASVLILVFVSLILVFTRKKSIQYRNALIVLSIVTIGELLVNGYYQIREYNMYPMESMYYHKQSDVLMHDVEIQPGTRIAANQIESNYGTVSEQPYMSARLPYSNMHLKRLCMALGFAGDEEYYELFGASPLINNMFNISYGMAQNDVAFSDVDKVAENEGYKLYQIQRQTGLGYMVDNAVVKWKYDSNSPFEIQNDYVRKALNGQDIFDMKSPDLQGFSVLGGKRYEEELRHGEEGHVHEEEEVVDYTCEYDEQNGYYHYLYKKMYDNDVVSATFESDGESDYYVYIKSDQNSYMSVNIGEETVYTDQVSGKQKMFHIGKVDKGTTISLLTYGVMDNMQDGTIYYQIAAFDEDAFEEVYQTMQSSIYEVSDVKDGYVDGHIQVTKAGIMMTSIPALQGISVYVDGEQKEYETIGDALIGVPLEIGDHEVVVKYTPTYIIYAVIIAAFGLILFIIACIIDKKYSLQYDKEINEE